MTAEPVAAPARQPWEQQVGENPLWWARFLRYLALGPGRSVSLVAKGRRNAYPIPAHWPIQAKQYNWRERALATDQTARRDGRIVVDQVNAAIGVAILAAPERERHLLEGVLYSAPPDDDEAYSSAVAAV